MPLIESGQAGHPEIKSMKERVLLLWSEGKTSNKKNARELLIGLQTMKNYANMIFSSLGIEARGGGHTKKIKAIRRAIDRGIMKPFGPSIKTEDTPIYQLAAKNHPEMVESKK